jgi:hypothetical protein
VSIRVCQFQPPQINSFAPTSSNRYLKLVAAASSTQKISYVDRLFGHCALSSRAVIGVLAYAKYLCAAHFDDVSAITIIERAGLGPKVSHSEAPKSRTVLFEIRGRVVEDFVLL